jgi:hypothetical protein
MPVVGFPHLAKLIDVASQSIPLRSREMVIVEYVLDGANGIIEVALVELAAAPIVGKSAKLFFGFIEPITVAVRQMPAAVPLIEI